MKVFVTGANGCVGASLCRKLVEQGDDVSGLVRKTSDLSLLEGLPVRRVTGSLGDIAALDEGCRDASLVYHAAAAVTDWGSLDYFRNINVEGTRNVLESSIRCGVRRFVHVSSAAVHSFLGRRNMDERSPMLPTPFPYCRTKREAEALVMEAHASGRIETVIVRPGDVYGPGDRVSFLQIAPLLIKGRLGTVGGGRTLGAFTYVENLADGLILAGTKEEAAGEAFILTDGNEISWGLYFETLCRYLNAPKPAYSLPAALLMPAAALLEGVYRLFRVRSRPPITRYLIQHLAGDFHFSIAKARALLGYEPRVGFEEAVRKTVEWYRSLQKADEKPE